MNRRLSYLSTVVLCGIVAAGCGAPAGATYVDPNDDTLFSGASMTASTTEPFATYGTDVAQRALAIVRLRGALATARVLQPTDPAAARTIVAAALNDDFSVIEPTLALRAPDVRARVHAHLAELARNVPADITGYAASIQRGANVELTQVSDLVIPQAARQDPAFRAGVMIESINDASVRYGNAVDGGLSPAEALAEYRTAYGILLDVRTRGLDAITIDDRRKVQLIVTSAANRSLPTPSIPQKPVDATTASTELSLAADFITSSTGADTTLPAADVAAPAQWRGLKRSVASALETWRQGDATSAYARVRAAATNLDPAATASLATVDPELLVSVLRLLDIDLPAEMHKGGAPESVVAHLDADIDSAVTAIEHELALARQENGGA